MTTPEDGAPEKPSLEQLKKCSKNARQRAWTQVSNLPSDGVLGLLEPEYFTPELLDALKNISRVAAEARRLYEIAHAKQERDRARATVENRTALIEALEAGEP